MRKSNLYCALLKDQTIQFYFETYRRNTICNVLDASLSVSNYANADVWAAYMQTMEITRL